MYVIAGIEREITSLQLEVKGLLVFLLSSLILFIIHSHRSTKYGYQEKRLVAEIKKTAKTGNEVKSFLTFSSLFC